MKKAWKTTEFWFAAITQIAGVAVLMGLISPEQSINLSEGSNSIVGGVMMILSALGYIKNRTEVKKARVNASKVLTEVQVKALEL